MLAALIFIAVITFGGTILTYFYEKEDALLARAAAGNVTGSVVFGLAAFLLAGAFGFSTATIFIALAITLLPAILLANKATRESFAADLYVAKSKLENTNLRKISSLVYYLAFAAAFYFFFDRAMIETANGIFTGASQNLGDLPFHLGAIFSFTEGGNVPPENPSFAFAKFTYPFMADFIAACLMKFGAGARDAMLAQNVTLAFALVVLFEKFTFALTKNHLAKRLAPVIFLLSGGLGFVLFFRDYWHDGRSFFEFLWNLKDDYTIRPDNLRWGNPLVVLFITQRSLLLGMPLALIALTKLREIFTSENKEIIADENDEQKEIAAGKFSVYRLPFTVFVVGLLAGTLPLVHVHSLIVLFVVTAFLFFLRVEKWREWIAFGAGVAVVAVPELVWAMTGSATRTSEFFGWHFGWDARQNNFFLFWLLNLGFFIPLLLVAVGQLISNFKFRIPNSGSAEQIITNKAQSSESDFSLTAYSLALFYLPFVFFFVVSNIAKLAPWEWDNIKVLIYWFVGSVPLVALLLAKWWEKSAPFKIIAAACLLILTLSGALDIWRTMSKQINYEVFSRDAVKIAGEIKQKTAPRALFLNAPTYNSAVVLSGRRSLMRYSGHLSSYGIDYEPREEEVKRIYEGTALADRLLKKYNIEYVIVSPEETANGIVVNEDFFTKFPIVAEVGAYRVYQIKQ